MKIVRPKLVIDQNITKHVWEQLRYSNVCLSLQEIFNIREFFLWTKSMIRTSGQRLKTPFKAVDLDETLCHK